MKLTETRSVALADHTDHLTTLARGYDCCWWRKSWFQWMFEFRGGSPWLMVDMVVRMNKLGLTARSSSHERVSVKVEALFRVNRPSGFDTR